MFSWARALCVIVCFSLAVHAHADSYINKVILESDASSFVAADDFGDYVIYDETLASCSQGVCYIANVNGQTSYTSSIPTLRSDPNAPAGPGCTATSAGDGYVGATECFNGYEFLLAEPAPNVLLRLYSGFDLENPIPGSTSGVDFNASIITPNGSLYYINAQDDTLDVALNLTTTVTPEPSGIALLGTGLLGVAGLVKRRFA